MRLGNITHEYICHGKGGIPKKNFAQKTGRQASKEERDQVGWKLRVVR